MAQDGDKKSGSGSRHVRDVMTANPECVGEKDSLRDVARIMKDKDTGVVPVVDGKKILGLITDRDIVVRGLAEGKNLDSAPLSEIMTSSVRSVRDDASVNDALAMMTSAEIRRVPVVNSENELVGILSLGDIAAEGNQDGKVGSAIEDISEAPPNN
ncbi:MAG: CBS domain-containing protein [Acidobacteriota bacterium]